MPDTVESLGLTPPPVQFKTQDEIGFGSLQSEDFLRLFLTELQNQDPTEPTSNEAILTQMSQMRDLEASVDLEETLKSVVDSLSSLATGNELTSAASLIGRTVTGTVPGPDGESTQEISGVVESARLKDGVPYVSVGGVELAVADLTSVAETAGP